MRLSPRTLMPFTPPKTSSLRSFSLSSVLTKRPPRLYHSCTIFQSSTNPQFIRLLSTSQFPKMASQKQFSNTDSVPSDKPADPYKATNLTDPELPEKVQDLVKFIESCKFGMMTTRIESSGLLTSRCMALAAKVRFHSQTLFTPSIIQATISDLQPCYRKAVESTSSSTPTLNRARRTT